MQQATVIAAAISSEAGTRDAGVFTPRTPLLFCKAARRSRQPPFMVIRSTVPFANRESPRHTLFQ
jgi:hypothetical protein